MKIILWPIAVIMEDQSGRWGYGKYVEKALTSEDKKVLCSRIACDIIFMASKWYRSERFTE